MRKTLITLSFALLLLSCSDPLSKKYSKDSYSQDISEIQKKDSTNAQIIALTLARYSLAGVNISDMSYQKILDDGKKFQDEIKAKEIEEKRLAQVALSEELSRISKLTKAVSGSIFSIEPSKIDYNTYIKYGVVLENKSNKDIRAVKGSFQINDIFDTEIKTIEITFDNPVKTSEKSKDYFTTDYNQFNDADNVVISKKMEDLKIIWKPLKIIYKDGSTLE